MVSEFRRNKLLRGFKAMDTDKNGNIEKEDFEKAIEGLKKMRGWEDTDPKYIEMSDYVMKFWEGVRSLADTDNDGKVTEEEWLDMWDEYAKNPAPLEWQEQYAKFMFDLLDTTNDGAIDHDEFVVIVTKTGKSEEDAELAFQKISKGKPTIEFEDFRELWKEYFVTEDPEAPGNFIFGTPDS